MATPSSSVISQVQTLWSSPGFPMVMIHALVTSYEIFEIPIEYSPSRQLKLLESIIYLSVQISQNEQYVQEMLQMKVPQYYFPILKSENAPESLKISILCLFIEMLKKSDGSYFLRNELFSYLLLELSQVESQLTVFCLKLIHILVKKQSTQLGNASVQALQTALECYLQATQPLQSRSSISSNIALTNTILDYLDDLN